MARIKTSITGPRNLSRRRYRTYPRVIKRARRNAYPVKKPGSNGTRHTGPPPIRLLTSPRTRSK